MAPHGVADEAGGTDLSAATWILTAAFACAVALAATFVVRRHARTLGLMDAPNERSSHRVVTPRGGGVAIMLGSVLGLGGAAWFEHADADAWAVFGAAAWIGAVGLVDDRRGLPPLVRLLAQLAAAAVVVRSLGPVDRLPLPAPFDVTLPGTIAVSLSVLWMVAVTNFFNFMDGIDGLAGGQALATCFGVVVAAWSGDAVILVAAVGGACAGFLFHNWPPARVFMGDSGSGFLGFLLAALPFLAPAEKHSDAVLVVAAGLVLFLLDPLVTLVRRAWARKNIFQAHREHLYQQLVKPEEPAGPVTTAYTVAAATLALAGAAAYREPSLLWVVCIASLAVFVVVWRLAANAGGGSTSV